VPSVGHETGFPSCPPTTGWLVSPPSASNMPIKGYFLPDLGFDFSVTTSSKSQPYEKTTKIYFVKKKLKGVLYAYIKHIILHKLTWKNKFAVSLFCMGGHVKSSADSHVAFSQFNGGIRPVATLVLSSRFSIIVFACSFQAFSVATWILSRIGVDTHCKLGLDFKSHRLT